MYKLISSIMTYFGNYIGSIISRILVLLDSSVYNPLRIWLLFRIRYNKTYLVHYIINFLSALSLQTYPNQPTLKDRLNFFFKVTDNEKFLELVHKTIPPSYLNYNNLVQYQGSYVINFHFAYTYNNPACNISTYFFDSKGHFSEITIQQYHISPVNQVWGESLTYQTAELLDKLDYAHNGDFISYNYKLGDYVFNPKVNLSTMIPQNEMKSNKIKDLITNMITYQNLYYLDRTGALRNLLLLFDIHDDEAFQIIDYDLELNNPPFGHLHESKPFLVFIDCVKSSLKLYTVERDDLNNFVIF